MEQAEKLEAAAKIKLQQVHKPREERGKIAALFLRGSGFSKKFAAFGG